MTKTMIPAIKIQNICIQHQILMIIICMIHFFNLVEEVEIL
jgi:hypothetical protein